LTRQGFDAEAIAGSKGQFDVRADGRVVFSKEEAGRFPEDDEVLSALTQ
jgi:selT/selW/selH-like putative selenoprotein